MKEDFSNTSSEDKKTEIAKAFEEAILSRPPKTYWQIVRKEFFKSKLAVFGLFIVLSMFTLAIFAPFLANDRPFKIHSRFAKEYVTSWEAIYALVQDVRKHTVNLETKIEYDFVKKHAEDYEDTKDDEIDLDEICFLLKKNENIEKLKKTILAKRTEAFQIEEDSMEEADLRDANGSDEFIQFLRNMESKFDLITTKEVIQLLKKKTSIAKIKQKIAGARANPFNIEDFEDELESAGADQGFLNYLSNYKWRMNAYLEGKFKIREFPFEKAQDQFNNRIQDLIASLPSKTKELQKEQNRFKKILEDLKGNKAPNLGEIHELTKTLSALKPAWKNGKNKSGIKKSELTQITRYPILSDLGAGDFFFMSLFFMIFLAPFLFSFVDKIISDPFYQAFGKMFALFFLPFVISIFWFFAQPTKKDNNNYPTMVQELSEGGYAYIQPLFFNPKEGPVESKDQPPSWAKGRDVLGFECQVEGKKIGRVLYETFEIKKDEKSGKKQVLLSSLKALKSLKKQNPKLSSPRIVESLMPENEPLLVNRNELVVLQKGIHKFKHKIIIKAGGMLIVDPTSVFEHIGYPDGFYWRSEEARLIPNYHVFGTDGLGRDIFTRMIWGSRISLAVGFVAVGIYVSIGIFLGALAGFFAGKVDMFISRMIEVMICFPTLILIITVIAVLPPKYTQIWSGMFAIMVVLGITGWTGIARLIRGEFLRLRNLDFVTAGRALGVSNLRLIFRHIVPNALAPVLVAATFGIASAILVESSLSFLGLGVQPPVPTWGDMLSKAQGKPLELWWLTLFPGMAIFITVTSYNLVGEGIRDALDPRLKER